jgi:integrase/recombinase XerC/integrase/recombinase XerD
MELTIQKAIDLFLLEQEIKGNSPKTIEFYRSTLGYFTDFFGTDKLVSDINLSVLNEYILMLRKRNKLSTHPFKPSVDKPIEKVSLQTYQRSLRVFLSFLYANDYIEHDFTKKFKLVKKDDKVIMPLTDEEIQIIVNYYSEKTPLNCRNKSILLLMLDCGLRLSEVVDLKIDNVYFDKNLILVTGKGSKQRMVPMGKRTKSCLMRYVTLYRPCADSQCKAMFFGKYNEPITENVIKMFFQRLKKNTGIERLKPHLLRHTFATLYMLDGGDLESLRILLGHTDLKTTQVYLHMANTHNIVQNNTLSHIDKIYIKRLKQ